MKKMSTDAILYLHSVLVIHKVKNNFISFINENDNFLKKFKLNEIKSLDLTYNETNKLLDSKYRFVIADINGNIVSVRLCDISGILEEFLVMKLKGIVKKSEFDETKIEVL